MMLNQDSSSYHSVTRGLVLLGAMDKHSSQDCGTIKVIINRGTLASFPGLPRLQFLIACSIMQAIKNWSRGRPGNEARVHDMQQTSRKAESGDHKHAVNDM